MITARLEAGRGVRLYGPASLRVEEGLALILGVPLPEGRTALVPAGRSYYVMAQEETVLSVELEPGARVEAPGPGEEPLPEWVETVDQLLDQCEEPCRIIVLGPVDAGKTSITALIANRAFQAGLRPYIIDSDIGQADIGPPGFVSGSLPEEPVLWLRSLEPDRMVFVGHVEPGHVQAQIVYALLRLLERAREARSNIVAVDTDGWVEGWHALEAKMGLLRAARASAVVVVGSGLLYRFVRDRWPGRVAYLRSPTVSARRDRSARIALRSENYKRFLDGATRRELSLRTTPIINACVPPAAKAGRAGGRQLYEYPGGVCALYNREDPPGPGEARDLLERWREAMIVYTGGFRGVLVGLETPEGWDYPGIIEDVDLERGVVTVRTRYLGPVQYIVAGRLRLSEDYQDTGARRIWV